MRTEKACLVLYSVFLGLVCIVLLCHIIVIIIIIVVVIDDDDDDNEIRTRFKDRLHKWCNVH